MQSQVSRQRKIIFFELNEVPFEIIDYYCQMAPHSTLAQTLSTCWQSTTVSEDQGHLSPWITWPTVHRGVNNLVHGIEDLNQGESRLDPQHPPIWELLSHQGIDVGVFGSLHSYPLPENYEKYSFYLPDTFAPDPQAFPSCLKAFQDFNLKMVGLSGRNVSSKVLTSQSFSLLSALPWLGISTRTIGQILVQLMQERTMPERRCRRRVFQSILSFDVFLNLVKKKQPQFTTYFTNHVASSMHRYWAATFPEQFSDFSFDQQWVNTYKNEIFFAMKAFDGFFARLKRFCDSHQDYQLWILSSMGQKALRADPVETQLYVKKLDTFLRKLGAKDGTWKALPCMLPQCNFSIAKESVNVVRSKLATLKVNGTTVDFRENSEGMFGVDLGHPNLHKQGFHIELDGRSCSLEDLGWTLFEVEDKSTSSAYHVKEGSWIIYDPQLQYNGDELRKLNVPTHEIAARILKNFDIRLPKYMQDRFLSKMVEGQ